jgi:predicted deacylase
MDLMKIGGLEVKKGIRIRGNLRVGSYFYHKRAHLRRWVLIPFTVIRGIEDGPTLCVTAGCHPNECSGIDAAIRLTREIKPRELKGTLVVIPVVNTPGFWERAYINPIDGKNLQGLYPGTESATRGERGEALQSTQISDLMTYMIFHEIVMKANYLIDYHGGDYHEVELWSLQVNISGNEKVDRKSITMAMASGIIYIEYKTPDPGYLRTEAAKRGIPNVVFELCQGGLLLPEESQAIFDGTLNIMRHLRMIHGNPKVIKNQPGTVEGQKQTIIKNRMDVNFMKSGLYYSDIKAGDKVEKGQKVGELKNLEGETIETIYAPATGIVLTQITNPVKLKGDCAMRVYW